MAEATVRELRNHGGDILKRVEAGEIVTVTRDGTPVAEIFPLRRRAPRTVDILAALSRMPAIDPSRFRSDVDACVDQTL